MLRPPLELRAAGCHSRCGWEQLLSPPGVSLRGGVWARPDGGVAGPSPQISQLRPAMGAMEARGARVALCGVTLLCAVGLGQRPAGGLSCGPGRLLRGTGTDARCCRLCAPGKARAGSLSRRAAARRPLPALRHPGPLRPRRAGGRPSGSRAHRPRGMGEGACGREQLSSGRGPKGESGARGARTFPKAGLGSQGGGRLSQLLLSG